MTLYQIFFWFLKLNDVSYELRSLYNSNPQYNYKDYYTNNNNNLFITIKSLHDFFDERVSESTLNKARPVNDTIVFLNFISMPSFCID